MATVKRHSGSALTMVIGLLAILAMLGTSFLAISHMESRRGRAMVEKIQADPIPGGVLRMVERSIARDARYMTYADFLSPWLASEYYTGMTSWRRLSDIGLYLREDGHYNDVPIGARYFDDRDGRRHWYVDTDGDGVNDAVLFPTGVRNDRGEEYYAGVRIEDLSRYININVAFSPTQPHGRGPWYLPPAPGSPPYTPAIVDLERFLGNADAWNRIVQGYELPHRHVPGRQGLEVQDMSWQYDAYGASRLWSPAGQKQYRPYGVADEMFLRWRSPHWHVPDATAQAHRLHPMLYTEDWQIPRSRTRQLTALSASRSLLRRSPRYRYRRIPLWQSHHNGSCALDDADTRARLITRLNEIAGATGQQAQAVVANLWAQISLQSATEQPFQVGAHFGVVEQLVITDVYVYYSPPTPLEGGTFADDGGYGVAIEMRNPSTKSVDTGTYHLRIANETFAFPDTGVIPHGHGVVLYAHQGRVRVNGIGPKTPAHSLSFGFGHGLEQTGWHEMPQLASLATHGATVDVVRVVAGHVIPVDRVTAQQLNYAPTPGNRDVWRVAVRDDDLVRSRHTVAVHKLYGETAAPGREEIHPTSHRLGRDNHPLAGPGVLSWDELFGGFYLRRTQTIPHSFGDMGMLYTVAPTTSSALPELLVAHRTQVARGRLDFFDNFGRWPEYWDPYGHWKNWAYGAYGRYLGYWGYWGQWYYYGRLPWAVFVQECIELVPTDPTRPIVTAHAEELLPELQNRVYGRINVNTASRDVLQYTMPRTLHYFQGGALDGQERYLAWPLDTDEPRNADRTSIADYLIAYRDHLASPRDYTDRAETLMLPDMPHDIPQPQGFYTPGEVAVPLADWFHVEVLGWSDYQDFDNVPNLPTSVKEPSYLELRNAFYAAISNQIDARSDTFVVYVYVQLGGGNPAHARQRTRHMAILDRSNSRHYYHNYYYHYHYWSYGGYWSDYYRHHYGPSTAVLMWTQMH